MGRGGGAGSGGGRGGPTGKPPLDKAKKAGDAVGGIGGQGLPDGLDPSALFNQIIEWQMEMAAEIDKALGGDPPRQDYTVIAEPETRTPDLGQRPDGVSEALWASIGDLSAALASYNAIGQAATISCDRYGGAAAAQDLQWASVPASSLIHYRKQLRVAAIEVADALEAFGAELDREGVGSGPASETDAAAAIADLRAQGFSADRLAITPATWGSTATRSRESSNPRSPSRRPISPSSHRRNRHADDPAKPVTFTFNGQSFQAETDGTRVATLSVLGPTKQGWYWVGVAFGVDPSWGAAVARPVKVKFN